VPEISGVSEVVCMPFGTYERGREGARKAAMEVELYDMSRRALIHGATWDPGERESIRRRIEGARGDTYGLWRCLVYMSPGGPIGQEVPVEHVVERIAFTGTQDPRRHDRDAVFMAGRGAGGSWHDGPANSVTASWPWAPGSGGSGTCRIEGEMMECGRRPG
jgi:hypothetical protein